MKKYLLFFLIALSTVFAQYSVSSQNTSIDTSDFFPLQDGNLWGFAANTVYGVEYLNLRVIKDTLMPNGTIYKYISGWYGIFVRKDSSNIYQYYGDSIACIDREYKYLDFQLPDSSVWSICRDLGPGEGNARGISSTFYDYTYWTFFQKPLETKDFEDVYIDSTDTLWTPGEGSIPMRFAKGIGPVRIFIFQGGDYWLQGAIIDGQQFGTLVSIEEKNNNIPHELILFQNYPNPFNPVTIINYQIPVNNFVTLKLYNTLGEEIATLVNEEKPAGRYSVNFDGSSLPSGVYVYRLNAGNFTAERKMVLVK